MTNCPLRCGLSRPKWDASSIGNYYDLAPPTPANGTAETRTIAIMRRMNSVGIQTYRAVTHKEEDTIAAKTTIFSERSLYYSFLPRYPD